MSAETADEPEDYLRAFETVYRLHQEGRSFSGRERHCAFLNTGGRGPFATVSAVSGLDLIDDGRAIAAADWDHDGDLDLWLANRTAPQLRFLRNDRLPDGRFLAVLLSGRTANRDAIGARAELHLRPAGDGAPATLVRTVRAGDGFLAQSSSWLHFGLANGAGARGIDRLVVRWPGGARETFTGLEAGLRYRIVEGEGHAEIWTPPVRRVALGASPELSEKIETPGRALLVGRPPIPLVTFRDFAGDTVDLQRRIAARKPGGPTLLNLWASWCLPCAAELRDLEERAGELRAAGLEVIALSVDGLDPQQATGPEDARAFVDRLGASFLFGFADAALLDRLQLLHDRMFTRHVPLAVPTSLLVDGDGLLAAVYRGAVDLEQLLDDVRNLPAPVEQRRDLATPMPGKWFSPPQALSLTAIARRFADDGFEDDAIHYLRHALTARHGDDADLRIALGELYSRQGDLDAAAASFRQALRLRPRDARASHVLADLLAAEGRAEEALAYYLAALEVRPRAVTRFNYGNALQQLGRTEEAISQYREALRLDDGLAGAHNNLGALLLAGGEPAAAAEHFARALELDPDDAGARSNLALARRALRDPQR